MKTYTIEDFDWENFESDNEEDQEVLSPLENLGSENQVKKDGSACNELIGDVHPDDREDPFSHNDEHRMEDVSEEQENHEQQNIRVNHATIEKKINEVEPENFTPEAWSRIRAYVKKRKEEESSKRITEAENLEKMLKGEKETGRIPVPPKIIVPPPQAATVAAPQAQKRPLIQNNRNETNRAIEELSSFEFIQLTLFVFLFFTMIAALMFIPIVALMYNQ